MAHQKAQPQAPKGSAGRLVRWTVALVVSALLVSVVAAGTTVAVALRPRVALRRAPPTTPQHAYGAHAAASAATPTPDPRPTLGPEVDGYQTLVYTDAHGARMTYYLHVPAGYSSDPNAVYPLVLLLHGVGEDARSNHTVAQNRAVILEDPYVQVWSSPTIQAQWPSFILVPQVVSPSRWVNVPGAQGTYSLAAQPSDNLAMAYAILTQVEQEYALIDPDRVYITGISMGAYGVWDAIERWPHAFAAAAPVAGGGSPDQTATLVRLPLWAFHRADDAEVPVTGSSDMIAAIQAAGGAPCFTTIPGTTHDIWMLVYGDAQFMQWLFAQGTPSASQGAVPNCVAGPNAPRHRAPPELG